MNKPTILFENDNVMVVDKPAGLIVHPSSEEDMRDSVASWFIDRCPEAFGVGENQMRSGIVHRLDQDTSGVLILAKNEDSYLALKEQFAERHVTKIYRALVYGTLKEERGVIDRSLATSADSLRRRTVALGGTASSRTALTYWKVLKRFPEEAHVTYVELYPKTGRTHQIRIHMQSIGHGVVCDRTYMPKGVCPVGGLARQALHAYSLEIVLPGMKGSQTFAAPLPEDFEAALRFLRGLAS